MEAGGLTVECRKNVSSEACRGPVGKFFGSERTGFVNSCIDGDQDSELARVREIRMLECICKTVEERLTRPERPVAVDG